MIEPNSEPLRASCVSDSPNTDIFYDDGEGDTTARPIPPELLPQAITEREKIQAWLAARQPQAKTADGQ